MAGIRQSIPYYNETLKRWPSTGIMAIFAVPSAPCSLQREKKRVVKRVSFGGSKGESLINQKDSLTMLLMIDNSHTVSPVFASFRFFG